MTQPKIEALHRNAVELRDYYAGLQTKGDDSTFWAYLVHIENLNHTISDLKAKHGWVK